MRRAPDGVGRIVHYYVHGRGRGHATRSRAIIGRLRARGHAVRVFAGADALPVLEPVVFGCTEVTSLPPRPSVRSLTLGTRRFAQALWAAWNEPPDVIVSDGDHPAILAGRVIRRPTIAVGHGLVFSRCARPDGLPRLPWWREALKATVSSWPADRYVPVNFVPLPVTRRSTLLARPVLDERLHAPEPARGAPENYTVVCYFRDGNGAAVIPVLEAALEPDDRVISYGGTTAASEPSEDPVDLAGRVETRPLDRAAFLADLRTCDLVVASAGSQLISECVALGKPIFALFRPDDDEQRLNVSMLRALGAGDGCGFDELTAERLGAFMRSPPRPLAEVQSWNAPDAAQVVLSLIEELG